MHIILPFSKVHAPQLSPSELSLAPQSLTKSQILFEGTQIDGVFAHLMAQGFGVGVGVGATIK